jgi:putative tryptophan/tyrosine transport system substrate-binding protein
VNRRAAALIITFALAILAAPLAASAQKADGVPRIGFISMRSGPRDNAQLDAFRQGLSELGYLEGRNVVLETRYAAGSEKKLPQLAAELVRLKVDVIVTQSGVAGLAARDATQTIPIVMASSADAVRQGLVASLARPGGNVTRLTMISPELSQKRLELLRELFPKLLRAGVLWCGAGGPIPDEEWAETLAAADVLKVKLSSLDVRGSKDLASAFVSAARQSLEAIMVFDCSRLHPSAARITELSLTNRLPALYPYAMYTEAGGLMSYGPSVRDAAHRTAAYVDISKHVGRVKSHRLSSDDFRPPGSVHRQRPR